MHLERGMGKLSLYRYGKISKNILSVKTKNPPRFRKVHIENEKQDSIFVFIGQVGNRNERETFQYILSYTF